MIDEDRKYENEVRYDVVKRNISMNEYVGNIPS